jgi:hypothetical protein
MILGACRRRPFFLADRGRSDGPIILLARMPTVVMNAACSYLGNVKPQHLGSGRLPCCMAGPCGCTLAIGVGVGSSGYFDVSRTHWFRDSNFLFAEVRSSIMSWSSDSVWSEYVVNSASSIGCANSTPFVSNIFIDFLSDATTTNLTL